MKLERRRTPMRSTFDRRQIGSADAIHEAVARSRKRSPVRNHGHVVGINEKAVLWNTARYTRREHKGGGCRLLRAATRDIGTAATG